MKPLNRRTVSIESFQEESKLLLLERIKRAQLWRNYSPPVSDVPVAYVPYKRGKKVSKPQKEDCVIHPSHGIGYIRRFDRDAGCAVVKFDKSGYVDIELDAFDGNYRSNARTRTWDLG